MEKAAQESTQTVPTESSPSQQELALEIWRERPISESEVDVASIRHGLTATSCFADAEAEQYYDRVLREFLSLFRGERAFLFEVLAEQGETPELGRCLVSIDIDGDPVRQPERKVPRKKLLECATAKEPFFRDWCESGEEAGRESSLLALPAVSRDHALAVIVVENRFQDLPLCSEVLRTAIPYCRSLGGHLDLLNTISENESLWQDLSRIRLSANRSAPSSSTPATRSGRRKRRRKREGLRGDYSTIVGSCPNMLEILQVIDRISGSNAPVLINGDSGTGKELIALAVHNNSPRKGKIFVSENCAAITETLLESELFGYAKGAFTGAHKDHKGLFEQAVGGTLFLDEVGDMSPSMQKKLLRVLQEGVIRRVGAKEFTSVDVRIISATNKDLLAECRAGNFREDLYYRLNVINLKLPPLRERRDDIPELVDHILEELAEQTGAGKSFSPAALEKLLQYSWPGNIRELQNEVKKLFALADGDVIQVKELSDHLLGSDPSESPLGNWHHELSHMTLKEATEQLEREMIRRALTETGGNKSVVAKTLQIPKTSLYNKIHKYKL